jgi:hypothetical protein
VETEYAEEAGGQSRTRRLSMSASTRTRSSRREMMSLRTDIGAVGAVSYGWTASIIQVKKLSHAVLLPMPTRTRVVDRGRTTSRTLKGIPSADVVEMNFRRRKKFLERRGRPVLGQRQSRVGSMRRKVDTVGEMPPW